MMKLFNSLDTRFAGQAFAGMTIVTEVAVIPVKHVLAEAGSGNPECG